MNPGPIRDPHEDDRAESARRRQEEALDDALENTFPASTRFLWSNQPPATIFGKQILALAPAQFMEFLFELDCAG
jgi:hypothetical protein